MTHILNLLSALKIMMNVNIKNGMGYVTFIHIKIYNIDEQKVYIYKIQNSINH